MYHGDCVRPKLKGVCIDALNAADSGVCWFCGKFRRFSSALLLSKLRNFQKTFVKLSSSFADLSERFALHGKDYLLILHSRLSDLPSVRLTSVKAINQRSGQYQFPILILLYQIRMIRIPRLEVYLLLLPHHIIIGECHYLIPP